MALEVKVARIVDLAEDLHSDMTRRHARWEMITGSFKYVAWLTAGAMTLLGFSRSDSAAGWLFHYPSH